MGTATSLQRVAVYQVTGMIIGQLAVDAAAALVRLRATRSPGGPLRRAKPRAIVERRVSVTEDESFRPLPKPPDGRPA